MEINWFMIYTKPEAEKKVLDQLLRRQIECYWPQLKPADAKQATGSHHHPLLKSYVFVRVEKNMLQDLKKIPGVVNTVYWLNKPVVITADEIKYMQAFLKENTTVSIENISINTQWLNLPDKPALYEVENIHNGTAEQKSLTLFSLGFKLSARARKGQVQIITSRDFEKSSTYKFSLTDWILGN